VPFDVFLPVFVQFELFKAYWTRKGFHRRVCSDVALQSNLRCARKGTLLATKRLVLLHVSKVLRLNKEGSPAGLANPAVVHCMLMFKAGLKRSKRKAAVLTLVILLHEGCAGMRKHGNVIVTAKHNSRFGQKNSISFKVSLGDDRFIITPILAVNHGVFLV